MKNCDEMVESLFERRKHYVAEKKKKIKLFFRAVTAISCVCFVLLLGIGVLIYKNNMSGNSVNSVDNDLPIVSSFDVDVFLPSYPTPKNGELRFTMPLGEAMEAYGEDALYHVYLQVFDDGELLPADSEQVKEETERLSSNGYKVVYETYSDETSEQHGIAIYARLNEIKEFDINENYGYFMFLNDECGEWKVL